MANAVENLSKSVKVEPKVVTRLWLGEGYAHAFGATEVTGPRYAFELLTDWGHVRVTDTETGKSKSFPTADVMLTWG